MNRQIIWFYGFLGGLLLMLMPLCIAIINNTYNQADPKILQQTDTPYLIVAAVGLLFTCLWVVFWKQIQGKH